MTNQIDFTKIFDDDSKYIPPTDKNESIDLLTQSLSKYQKFIENNFIPVIKENDLSYKIWFIGCDALIIVNNKGRSCNKHKKYAFDIIPSQVITSAHPQYVCINVYKRVYRGNNYTKGFWKCKYIENDVHIDTALYLFGCITKRIREERI